MAMREIGGRTGLTGYSSSVYLIENRTFSSKSIDIMSS
jgi:hypothetical protein